MDAIATAQIPVVAWEVEIRYLRCVVFATTKAKAQWVATRYDRSALRFEPPKAFTEEYVMDSPNR